MNYPAFFDDIKTLTLYDPLAEFLGAAGNGLITYSYLETVKLAGHSCPTVAGAYLMTFRALETLHPGTTPERGTIRVRFRDDIANGVTGVIANVVGFLTGAAQNGGFKGIAGRFDRRNLMHFNAGIPEDIRFERTDTGAAVGVSYHPEIVPPSPAMREAMQKALSETAAAEDKEAFAQLWQERVKRILIDNFDNPDLVALTRA
jgi:hypothetical protein